VHLYDEAFAKFPPRIYFRLQTASTVGSRGIYKFPVVQEKMKIF
jgi:beta-galactosidase